MKRSIRLLALVLCVVTLLSGCGFSLDSVLPEKLKGLLGGGDIICQVTEKEGQLLTVEVLSPDSHYDEGDILYVQYTSITGGKSISTGDIITFTYDYLEGVTVKNDEPFILADSISPTEYTPPETIDATE